ncbi:hypothetical protein EV361DRAFT_955441 [Lentinula raphanica]|nr:hypothetical protein EV361DRAFT_955441 [Lentinula raphanica]
MHLSHMFFVSVIVTAVYALPLENVYSDANVLQSTQSKHLSDSVLYRRGRPHDLTQSAGSSHTPTITEVKIGFSPEGANAEESGKYQHPGEGDSFAKRFVQEIMTKAYETPDLALRNIKVKTIPRDHYPFPEVALLNSDFEFVFYGAPVYEHCRVEVEFLTGGEYHAEFHRLDGDKKVVFRAMLEFSPELKKVVDEYSESA